MKAIQTMLTRSLLKSNNDCWRDCRRALGFHQENDVNNHTQQKQHTKNQEQDLPSWRKEHSHRRKHCFLRASGGISGGRRARLEGGTFHRGFFSLPEETSHNQSGRLPSARPGARRPLVSKEIQEDNGFTFHGGHGTGSWTMFRDASFAGHSVWFHAWEHSSTIRSTTQSRGCKSNYMPPSWVQHKIWYALTNGTSDGKATRLTGQKVA